MQSPANKPALSAFKAADELRCRLFDHRQFTGGEIRHFVKLFEEKRQWQEEAKLTTSETLADKSKGISKNLSDQLSGDQIPSLLSKLDCLLNMTENLLSQEKVAEEKRLQRINERREEVTAEMELFNKEIEGKMQELDDQFKAKEQDLLDHYVNLEKNLKLEVYHNTRSDNL